MKRGIYIKNFEDSYSLIPHLDICYGKNPERVVVVFGFWRWEVEMWLYYKWEENSK